MIGILIEEHLECGLVSNSGNGYYFNKSSSRNFVDNN